MLMLTFLAVAGIGFLLLMVSLIFDGDSEIDLDADVDLDADFDADVDGGGSHWLSMKVICSFAVAFGMSGAAMDAYGFHFLPTFGVAILSGVVLGAIANAILSFFYSQQSSSSTSSSDLVGKQGVVILSIMPGQYGEVQVRLGRTTVSRRARCEDDEVEIRQGAVVQITYADASSVVVRKWKSEPAESVKATDSGSAVA